MTTVKEFNEFGLVFEENDAIAPSDSAVVVIVGNVFLDLCGSYIAKSFAWRPLNTLPDNPKFKYEKSEFNSFWRPLLDQSAVKPSDEKPVFTPWSETYSSDKLPKIKTVLTQEMADIEYELSLHKANSELLASLTDFMVKNGIGRIGESCIDVAIRELSEKFNIETRTPKQKAVDEIQDVVCSQGFLSKQDVSLGIAKVLYDAGYRKC